jgi:hypothetical protein
MDAACDCPYLDQNDPRCAGRLTLGHLDEAFSFCLDGYQRCPNFHRLNREGRLPGGARPPLRLIDDDRIGPPLTHVTCRGRSIAVRHAV